MAQNRHHALAREAILAALTAYTGITTADGAGDGSTLIDANLIGANDFISNKTILIGSGDGDREDSGASSFDPLTGTITVVSPFSAQIKIGTLFRVINISTVEIDVETINTKIGTNVDAAGTTTVFARLRQIVDTYLASGTQGLAVLLAEINANEAKIDIVGAIAAAIDTQTDKLGGETPVSDSVTGDWESGTGTSTEPGADLVTIGAADTKYKLHSLLVNISALTNGATITIKLFTEVNGTERKVYSQAFTKGTDPDGLWIVNGTVGIHEALRVEVQSNNAGDNAKSIDYDYLLEAM
jgi:hypothetical protein